MELTMFLAVWGAIVSTIALTWNIIRDRLDRGALRVEAMIGRMVPDHTDKDYLVVTITNVGRRPVLVKGWGGMKKRHVKGKRGILIVPRGLPRMLEEGEYHLEFTEDLSMLSSDIQKIYVWDSAGREWKVSRKNLKRLLAEATQSGSGDRT